MEANTPEEQNVMLEEKNRTVLLNSETQQLSHKNSSVCVRLDSTLSAFHFSGSLVALQVWSSGASKSLADKVHVKLKWRHNG